MFKNIDNANETLKSDDGEQTVESSNSEKLTLTYSQSAQLDVLQQTANLYRQYWQMALQNGGTLEINGKTKTVDELSQMYIDANSELEQYLNSIGNKEEQII